MTGFVDDVPRLGCDWANIFMYVVVCVAAYITYIYIYICLMFVLLPTN